MALGLLLASCAVDPLLSPTPSLPAPTPEPTMTPTEYRGLCAYVWSEQRLPETVELVNQAFRNAALEQVVAQVTAYGETCVDSGSDAVVRFTPQEINYALTIQVEETADSLALGDWLTQVVLVLGDFQAAQAPTGSKAGRVDVQFQDPSRSVVLSFPMVHALELVNQGVKGTALLDQLSTP